MNSQITRIALFDPSVCSTNLGDQIIAQSVDKVIEQIFENPFIVKIQTQDKISRVSYQHINSSSLRIVGGTNLLSSHMERYNQWKVNMMDALFISDIVLLGIGWWQYQDKPGLYTRTLLKKILHRDLLHSVRDEYTRRQLNSAGFNNIVNTSCPTLWSLTEEHCRDIPATKADAALLTFTSYNQKPKHDSKLLAIVRKHYRHVYLWPQHPDDWAYVQEMSAADVVCGRASLDGLDELLRQDVDYIGTRLHAGIRALQSRKRALVLSVDNRATEIHNDTGLPVVLRDDYDAIDNWITAPGRTEIRLPVEAIRQWKSQFRE